MADYNSSYFYGDAGYPYIETGGWPQRSTPSTDGVLGLVLPTDVVGETPPVKNRVWDTVAGGFHIWVTTNGPDPTGISYDGPGTYGVNTSNYSVVE